MQRTRLVAFAEGLHRKHGAGEREGKPDQSGFGQPEFRCERQARSTQQQQNSADNDNRCRHVDGGPSPHDRPGQRGQLQLQTNGEQQDQDAEVADLLNGRSGLIVEGVQDKPGCQISNERWKPNSLGHEPENKSSKQERRVHAP